MTSSNGDRDDLVQEVFLQVHRSLGEFRGQSKFSTWVHRIAVNVVLMARRAAKSRPVFAAELNADLDPTDDPLPDEGAARARRIEAFRRLVDRLADKKRAVFLLHELEGLSPADISAIVDAPVLTVRTRLFYARRELTEWLREEPALAELVRALEGDASPSSSSKTRDRFEEET